MKKLISPLALVALIAVCFALLPACQNMPTDGSFITTNRVEAISALAGYGGALAVEATHPEMVPALRQAQAALCALKVSGKLDAATILAILQQAGIPGLDSTEGQINWTGGIPILLDLFTGKSFSLDSQPYLMAFVSGLCDGLNLALGQPKASIFGDPIKAQLTAQAVATRPKK